MCCYIFRDTLLMEQCPSYMYTVMRDTTMTVKQRMIRILNGVQYLYSYAFYIHYRSQYILSCRWCSSRVAVSLINCCFNTRAIVDQHTLYHNMCDVLQCTLIHSMYVYIHFVSYYTLLYVDVHW